MKKKNKQQKVNNTQVVEKKTPKWKEKLEMYDMIIANLLAGKSIIEPQVNLNNSQIYIGFNSISSATTLTKYFVINEFPDYVPCELMNKIRSNCMQPGVKINFYTYMYPYKISWESAEMRSKLSIWEQYSKENPSHAGVFSYRNDITAVKARERIIKSTKYLNEAEIEQKRKLTRVAFIIEVSGLRNEVGLVGLANAISKLNATCAGWGIRVRELRINMNDWIRAINPFSLNPSKETDRKIIKKIMTDDNIANFASYKQGKIGTVGIPLGIDILSNSVVLRQFKESPDKPENWVVSAGTGGGKSLWTKSLIPYFLAVGYTVSIMDYEGDEYTNIAGYVASGNKEDVKVVSMGKSSAIYFDPCPIASLTGDDEVDADLKDNSINFIKALYRIMVHGIDEDFTTEENKIISEAIQRMYDSALVTSDKNTWYRSKHLRLHDVYYEIKQMVDNKEFVDPDNDNIKHRAAEFILDSTSVYFEEGEAYSEMFSKPMDADELFKARLVVFSFGMKGESTSSSDPKLLALKQMSVAYINIQISNYCKYVKHTFNVKIWEEFQRWVNVKSSIETIGNVISGGRKRGDINFIITNDLNSLLTSENGLTIITDNVQNYAIGNISMKKTREQFCTQFDMQDARQHLDKIAKSSKSKRYLMGKSTKNKYQHAFCIMLDDGTICTVKSMLPKSVLKSKLFRTGVVI